MCAHQALDPDAACAAIYLDVGDRVMMSACLVAVLTGRLPPQWTR